jgi:hypothetical protein
MLAFARREEQLMSMVGAVLSYQIAFAVFREVLKPK